MKLEFCCACGSKNNLQFHHLIPKQLGGINTDDNLLTLCENCHRILHNLKTNSLISHRQLSQMGNEKAQNILKEKGLWRGNWKLTVNSPEYNAYKEEVAKQKTELALQFSTAETKAAHEFAESLRADIAELYDITILKTSKYPRLKDIVQHLTECGHKARNGEQLTISSIYKALTRLGFDTGKRKPKK